MQELKILSATGALGYGLNGQSLQNAIDDHDIDVIGVDAGSNDSGPGNFGGSERIGRTEENVKDDLKKILKIRDQIDVPLFVGSTGVSGVSHHLDRVAGFVKELSLEEGLRFNMATIYSDVDKEMLKEEISDGNVSKAHYDKALTDEIVERSENIVAMIGHEPYIDAYSKGADVVLAGRSLDISQFAALPISEGFDRGLSYHLGKLLECGDSSLRPKSGREGVVGVIREDHFEIIPTTNNKRATIEGVAAQTLHEKTNPHEIYTPDGIVDISKCTYDQVTDEKVRVSGSEFSRSQDYQLMIEGVEKVGYRSLCIAGIPDPNVSSNITHVLNEAKEYFKSINTISEDRFKKRVRIYGNGESSLFETPDEVDVYELGIVIDVIGDTQNIANEVCKTFNNAIRKVKFDGKINIGGNFALSMSATPGKELDVGETYEWSINHLLSNVSSMEIVSTSMDEVGVNEVAIDD